MNGYWNLRTGANFSGGTHDTLMDMVSFIDEGRSSNCVRKWLSKLVDLALKPLMLEVPACLRNTQGCCEHDIIRMPDTSTNLPDTSTKSD